PWPSNVNRSWVEHDVQEPQSDSAITTAWQFEDDVVNDFCWSDPCIGRLLVAPCCNAPGIQKDLEPVNKFVASHFSNIEQRHTFACQCGERSLARPELKSVFSRGIA